MPKMSSNDVIIQEDVEKELNDFALQVNLGE